MGFVKARYKNFLYYRISEFDKTQLVDTVFTTRIGFDNNKLIENISQIINVPTKNIVTVKQVHGTDILNINKMDILNFAKKNLVEADGIMTNIKNMVLVTFHADCVPVCFLDKSKNIIATSHAGWKGTLGNISGKTVEKMIKYYDSKPENILVGIGPSIGSCCYEVGREVYAKFNQRYNFADEIFRTGNDEKTYLDLWKTNKFQLMDKGVPEENIYVSKLCTSCNNNIFYSYRKEKGTNNRLASVIRLKV